MALTLKAKLGQGAWALYRVWPDGTIEYGGGGDAQDDKTTWTDRLTAAEADELTTAIAEQQWVDREPTSSGEPADHIFTIDLSGPGGRRKYRVTGDNPRITPVLDLLDRIARRRFDEFLDEFPEPSGGR